MFKEVTIWHDCAFFFIFKCSLFKESHKESCKFCTAKCPYPGCNQVVHRSKFESHEESCDYRYSECRVCNVHVDWKEDGKVIDGNVFCKSFSKFTLPGYYFWKLWWLEGRISNAIGSMSPALLVLSSDSSTIKKPNVYVQYIEQWH